MISCRENEDSPSYLNPFPQRPDMILSKFLVKSVKLGQPTKADPGWKIEGNDDFFYLATCFYLKLLSKRQISNAKYIPKHQATIIWTTGLLCLSLFLSEVQTEFKVSAGHTLSGLLQVRGSWTWRSQLLSLPLVMVVGTEAMSALQAYTIIIIGWSIK